MNDVHFGYVGAPLPDWRKELKQETDPDDELIETPLDVVDVLGFDPAEEGEYEESPGRR
jgi:hypothetical protein